MMSNCSSGDLISNYPLLLGSVTLAPEVLDLILLAVGLAGMYLGIEIGHPVYSLLFTNLVFPFVVTVINIVTFLIVPLGTWLRISPYLNYLCLMFHSTSWCIISELRYLYILHRDWLESHWPEPKKLRQVGLGSVFGLLFLQVSTNTAVFMLLAKPYGWPEKSFFHSVPGPLQTTIILICLFVFLLPVGISIVIYILLLKQRKSFDTKNKVGIFKAKTETPGKVAPVISRPSADSPTQVVGPSSPDLDLPVSPDNINADSRGDRDDLRDSNPCDEDLTTSASEPNVPERRVQGSASDAVADEPDSHNELENAEVEDYDQVWIQGPVNVPSQPGVGPYCSSNVLQGSNNSTAIPINNGSNRCRLNQISDSYDESLPRSNVAERGQQQQQQQEQQPQQQQQFTGTPSKEDCSTANRSYRASNIDEENSRKIEVLSYTNQDLVKSSCDAFVSIGVKIKPKKASNLSQLLVISGSDLSLLNHDVEGLHNRKVRRSLSLDAGLWKVNNLAGFDSRPLNRIMVQEQSHVHQTLSNEEVKPTKRIHFECDFESGPRLTSVAELFKQEHDTRSKSNSDSLEKISLARIQAEKLSAMRSLKTNLMLISLFFVVQVFYIFPPKEYQLLFSAIYTSVTKSMLPLLTTVANFGNVRKLSKDYLDILMHR